MVFLTPASNSPFALGTRPEDLATGDLNNDGHLDVVTVNDGSNNISVLLGDGSGNFGSATNFGNSESSSPTIALDDFNRDGNLDIVVTTGFDFNTDNNFGVLFGDGTGNFGAQVNLSTLVGVSGSVIQNVTTEDFDLDGNPDLAFALDTSSGKVGIRLGDGAGNFGATEIFFGIGINPNTIIPVDLNKDNVLDLVLTTDILSSGGGVTVLIGNDPFLVANPPDPNNPIPRFQNPVKFTTGNNPTSIAQNFVAADFNNDNNPDIITANALPDNLSILLGDGSGGFSSITTFLVDDELSQSSDGNNPRFLDTTDFNLDGNQDLVVTTFEGTAILHGDGLGNFEVIFRAAEAVPNSGTVIVGDFNEDGRPDIASVPNLLSGSNDVTVLLNQETLRGSNSDDTIIGGNSDDFFNGLGGNDVISGSRGNDTINGGNDADNLSGQENNDRLVGGDGNDTLNGGNGDDNIFGQSDNDTLVGGDGNDTLNGGTGDDSILGQDDNDSLIGGSGEDTLHGGSGDDTLRGQNDDDSLIGGNGNDTLNGDAGNDTLNGGNDADIISGQNNNDRLFGGDGNDTLNGGNGADNISGQDDNDRLVGGIGNDTLSGGNGADNIFGQNDDDRLIGGNGNDTLNGNAGADNIFGQNDDDRLIGGNGNDTLNGDAGADSIFGQNNDDSLIGGDGNDTLIGGFGADILSGQDDNDRLIGGNNNDTLIGGLGLDILSGEAGSDHFRLIDGITTDRDIILDFQDGIDFFEGLDFVNINTVQVGNNTNITSAATNEILAVVVGIQATDVTEIDFV